jgi:DNA repair protein RadC
MRRSSQEGKFPIPGSDPRSRILKNPESLQDWELLSVLLGSGSSSQDVFSLSRKILDQVGGLSGIFDWNRHSAPRWTGIGPAKISRLIAVREMARRVQRSRIADLSDPFPFFEIYRSLWLETKGHPRESFFLVGFRPDGRFLFQTRLAQGSLYEVGIRKRDIARVAVSEPTAFVLLVHNHPGQTCFPSEEDREIFRVLIPFFGDLDIDCLDHWVLGDEGIFSCRANRIWEPEREDVDFLVREYGLVVDTEYR